MVTCQGQETWRVCGLPSQRQLGTFPYTSLFLQCKNDFCAMLLTLSRRNYFIVRGLSSESLGWFLCCALWHNLSFQRVKYCRPVSAVENLALAWPQGICSACFEELYCPTEELCGLLLPLSVDSDLGQWFPVTYWKNNDKTFGPH